MAEQHQLQLIKYIIPCYSEGYLISNLPGWNIKLCEYKKCKIPGYDVHDAADVLYHDSLNDAIQVVCLVPTEMQSVARGGQAVCLSA